MRLENTTEGQKHLTALDETKIVPARRDGQNGAVEVNKAWLDAFKGGDGNADYFTSGALVVTDGPKVVAPAKTDDEKAAANVDDALKRQAADAAEVEKHAKDKHKK